MSHTTSPSPCIPASARLDKNWYPQRVGCTRSVQLAHPDENNTVTVWWNHAAKDDDRVWIGADCPAGCLHFQLNVCNNEYRLLAGHAMAFSPTDGRIVWDELLNSGWRPVARGFHPPDARG